MPDVHLDQYSLTRFGAAFQTIMDGRGLTLEEVSRQVTDRFPERPVTPRILQEWMTSYPSEDFHVDCVGDLVEALEIDNDEAGRLGVAYFDTYRASRQRS